MFALACLYFRERECDFAVFEAGIGGRYDPVRLVGARIAAVTSVDYEHVALLGNSLELIASDKSDACAADGTVVYGENCRSLRPHLLEYNRYRRDRLAVCPRPDRDIRRSGLGIGPAIRFRLRGLPISLAGNAADGSVSIQQRRHRGRAVCALAARDAAQATPAAVEAAVRSGLRETRWPGRLEVIQSEPLTVVDVGHTPDAIRQALASLQAMHGGEGWILVTGASFDKKAEEIVGALAPSFDTVVCTAAHHKGADAALIAAAARTANPKAAVHVAATIAEAVEVSRTLAAGAR